MDTKTPAPKKQRTRKSSTSVTLVVIGAAAIAGLAGCAKEDVRRDVYANKEDCLADWGNSPADCEPAYDHPHSRGANTAYYGRPYIYSGNAGSPSRTGKTIGSSSSVSRGGFGASGHGSSGGG
jgi:uncharacterized protein YgiB involved in biofilm formation